MMKRLFRPAPPPAPEPLREDQQRLVERQEQYDRELQRLKAMADFREWEHDHPRT
jgi:hypothetical protein